MKPKPSKPKLATRKTFLYDLVSFKTRHLCKWKTVRTLESEGTGLGRGGVKRGVNGETTQTRQTSRQRIGEGTCQSWKSCCLDSPGRNKTHDKGMHHDGVTPCAGGMYLKPQRRRQALGRERASRGIPDVSTHLAGTRHTTKGCIVRASRAGGMCLDPQLNMRESLGFPL